MIAYQRVIDAFHANGCIVKETGNGKAECQAPGHSPADRSVSVRAIEGRVLVHCHSDPTDAVLDALGLAYTDLFDEDRDQHYTYPDGRIVRRTTKVKGFYQQGNTKGRSLYRADRLAAATVIYFVEGEQDVHAVEAEGAVATCNAQGAGKAHLFDLTPLHGKTVIIVRDDDPAGHAHALQVAELLAGKANVQIVEPLIGKDASDHIAAGHRLDEFKPVQIALIDRLRWLAEKLSGAADDAVAAEIYRELDAHGTTEGTVELVSFEDLAWEWHEWQSMEGAERTVIPSPWPELDDYLAGGFHPNRSYLIAGRPGGGKSIALVNVATKAAGAGYRGVLFSVEMDRIEVMSRMVASGAGVDYRQVTTRRLTDAAWQQVEKYVNSHREMPLLMSDRPELTIDTIRAICRKRKAMYGLDFVAVDYAQLLKAADRKLPRERQVAEISWGLKMMAKELNVAVITACQLNRNASKEHRPPDVSELRESGALEQDSDVVMLLHQPPVKEGESPSGYVDLIVGKNRTGPKGTVQLRWNAWKAAIG